jgi:hypothetical protein
MKTQSTVILSMFLLFSCSLSVAKTKLSFTYAQEDVHVMVDNKLLGKGLKSIGIDLNVVKSIKFFLPSHYPQEIKINSKTTTLSYAINLAPVPSLEKSGNKTLISTTPLICNEPVTNYTEEELGRLVKQNFKENSVLLGNSPEMFPNEVKLKDSKLVLSVQFISSEQVKGFYVFPYFNMASVTIQWMAINKETKEVVYNKEITQHALTRYKSTNGLQATDELKKVFEEAVLLNQTALINDKDFKKLFN